MGYGYGFLLSIAKLPDDHALRTNEEYDEFVENVIPTIVTKCKELEQKNQWFPRFGEKCHSGASSYATGENEHLIPALFQLSKYFPEITFAVYFLHWDYTGMDVYTLKDDKVIRKDSMNMEGMKFGCYRITASINMDELFVPGNLTGYFVDNGMEFTYDHDHININDNNI